MSPVPIFFNSLNPSQPCTRFLVFWICIWIMTHLAVVCSSHKPALPFCDWISASFSYGKQSYFRNHRRLLLFVVHYGGLSLPQPPQFYLPFHFVPQLCTLLTNCATHRLTAPRCCGLVPDPSTCAHTCQPNCRRCWTDVCVLSMRYDVYSYRMYL